MGQKVAIVTGANRGLGLATSEELSRQGIHVIMAGRNEELLKKAWQSIDGYEQLPLETFVLDVTSADMVRSLKKHVEEKFGHLDILVNNAGVLLDGDGPGDSANATIFGTDIEKVRQTLEINTLGTLRMMQEFLPLLKKSDAGRIVNVSSGMGQMSEMGGSFPGYRMSKSGVNVLTLAGARELEGTNVKMNAVCPGWVRTDMGGENATRNLSEGIKGIVWAATLPADGPSGGFFRDGQKLDW